ALRSGGPAGGRFLDDSATAIRVHGVVNEIGVGQHELNVCTVGDSKPAARTERRTCEFLAGRGAIVNHDGAFGPKHSESGLKVSHGTFEGVVRVDENDVVRQGWIEEVGDLVIRTAEGDFGAVLESGRTAVHKPVAPVKAGMLDLGEAEAGAGSADFKV